jgi:hypothetical protein
MIELQPAGIKRKRVSRACDFCHRRGRKCRLPEDSTSESHANCLTCSEYGVSCTWTRVASKRGMKPRGKSIADSQWTVDELKHGPRGLLDALVEVFFRDVYPM